MLDTGIDMTHPDLAEQIAHYDRGGASARDMLGHGAHVSGIIAAVANNDIGIAVEAVIRQAQAAGPRQFGRCFPTPRTRCLAGSIRSTSILSPLQTKSQACWAISTVSNESRAK